jgi:hypothetical protein
VPECSGKQTNFSRSCTAPMMPTIGTTQNFKLHAHSIDSSGDLPVWLRQRACTKICHSRLVTSLIGAYSCLSAVCVGLFSPTTALMSVSTHTGSSPPSYRSEVPSSIRSGSLADSVSTRTVSSPTSYRFAPLPPLPAPPPPPPSLVTAPDYAGARQILSL